MPGTADLVPPLTRQNSGTVGQGWRAQTLRSVSAAAPDKIFMLTVDYRGFGHSSGDPTEEGLIMDAVATVDWALHSARIPPERIVLLGQSLGTAVTAAVAEHFTATSPRAEFAGVVLVAPFSDLTTLLSTYSLAGILPVLSPLRPYPKIRAMAETYICDTWNTRQRIESYVRASRRVRLNLVHAMNDFDIPWRHSDVLFHVAANATQKAALTDQQIDAAKSTIELEHGGRIDTWRSGADKLVRADILRYGGE